MSRVKKYDDSRNVSNLGKSHRSHEPPQDIYNGSHVRTNYQKQQAPPSVIGVENQANALDDHLKWAPLLIAMLRAVDLDATNHTTMVCTPAG